MSSFATVKCPRCGTEQQLHLGGFGFLGQETTVCKLCGRSYSSIQHCIRDIPDREEYIPTKKTQVHPTQKDVIDLTKVSTKDLMAELGRRCKS